MTDNRFDWVAEDTKSCLKVHWFDSDEPGGSVKFTYNNDEIQFTKEEWEELKGIVEECFAANEE